MGKPVVIYDGECNLCAGNLPWLNRLDWFRVFEAMPYQSDEVYRRFPFLTRDACEKSMHLAFDDGRSYSGSDAFREIFLRMPLMFPVGLLISLPPLPRVLRRLYPILARNRYRLGGTCRLK